MSSRVFIRAYGWTFGSLGCCPVFAQAVQRDLLELDNDGVRALIARRTAMNVEVGAL